MTEPMPNAAFLDLDDDRAALDMGVLAAGAESALPGAPREAHLAMSWIAAHVAADGSRLWTARLDGLHLEGRDLGDWVLTVRAEPVPAQRIGIERRATLRSDGREVMALAHPFIEGASGDVDTGTESLLSFSLAMLASRAPEAVDKATIVSPRGSRLQFRLRKTTGMTSVRKKVSIIGQQLARFFPGEAKN